MANDMRQQLGKDAAGKSDDEVRKGLTGYYPKFINAYL
jgi:hypothetical protein